MESNRRFQQRSPEEMYFSERFAIPDSEAEGQWLSATTIFDSIRKAGGSILRHANLVTFSRALANIEGLTRRRTKRGTEYLVKPL